MAVAGVAMTATVQDLEAERFNMSQLGREQRENSATARNRKALRELRRQERVTAAAGRGEKARLDASWDYLRGVLRELEKHDQAAADRFRREASTQLMVLGSQAARR